MPAAGPALLWTSPVAAVRATDVVWAAVVALLVWGIGWAVIAAFARRQERALAGPGGSTSIAEKVRTGPRREPNPEPR
ncbi:MAG TPA: hypothetical protein VEA19_03155, partial [Actinomycetota bacterium]|nr:hypothetical protein [Actinomycetota bacterium]